jgi:DNA polymerase-1
LKISGGWHVDRDGRVRGTFTSNPSTLRLSMHTPNLQQIPRGNDSEYAKWVKDCFVAPEGHVFIERDFSAIEAVLVGLFAGSPSYIRFARMGVHAYLASHMLGRPADLKWSDSDVKGYFKQLKKTESSTYDAAKRVVHGSNYLMSARRMSELYPEFFPSTKEAAKLQSLYFELFPEIRKWHKNLCQRVDGTKRREKDIDEKLDPWTLGVCYVTNPFGYCHRFFDVLSWERVGDEWVSSYSEDSKRLIAFLPQSTAAAIIKKAAKRLFYETPWVGEYLRLLVHDSIMFECPEKDAEMVWRVSQEIMESPIEELPLDPEWDLGEYLHIGTEAKKGKSWGSMEG